MAKISDEAVANAMMELEDEIHSLNAMALIAADLLDDLKFNRLPQGGLSVVITEQQRNTMDFAVCNVCARSLTLKSRFEKATAGEVS